MALEADFCFVDLRSMDSKTLVTLALLDAFGTEQSLLTYFADLSGPAWRYLKYEDACFSNCLRFAYPAEATGGFEASMLGGPV